MDSFKQVDTYTNEIIRQLLRLFPFTYDEMEAYRLLAFYKKPMSLVGPFSSAKAWAYRLHSYQETNYLPEQWLKDIQISEHASGYMYNNNTKSI